MFKQHTTWIGIYQTTVVCVVYRDVNIEWDYKLNLKSTEQLNNWSMTLRSEQWQATTTANITPCWYMARDMLSSFNSFTFIISPISIWIVVLLLAVVRRCGTLRTTKTQRTRKHALCVSRVPSFESHPVLHYSIKMIWMLLKAVRIPNKASKAYHIKAAHTL